jgi:methionine sulfoxide reductase heme-binding subunit
LSTIVAIVAHGVSLLGDQFLHPTVADIAIPFVSGYRTGWTTLGIIAGWGLVLLGLSYYGRRRIGSARWRSLHRLTALVWLAGIAHSLGEGTDAGQTWFLATVAIVVVPALVLLIVRLAGGRKRTQPRPGRGAESPPAGAGAGLALQAGWVRNHEA